MGFAKRLSDDSSQPKFNVAPIDGKYSSITDKLWVNSDWTRVIVDLGFGGMEGCYDAVFFNWAQTSVRLCRSGSQNCFGNIGLVLTLISKVFKLFQLISVKCRFFAFYSKNFFDP